METATTTMASERRQVPLLPPDSRVGIIAGSGSLPVNVAQSLALAGHHPFIVIIEGEADRLSDLQAHQHVVLPLEAAAVAFDRMRKEGVTHAVLAGGIRRRPQLRKLRPTLRLITALPKVAWELTLGDDGLLRAVMRHIESTGIKLVGAQEIVPDLLAREGVMTRAAPEKADRRDIDAALQAALAIGRLDIGQAAIAVGGRVVALEGVEGTDGLLERMVALRSHGRLAGKGGGVLAKCTKPGQDLRADLPGIGVQTVRDAKRAGLRGIAVEANRAFVLDYADTIAAADDYGLFVVGVDVHA
jgi:hypothetical protein